MGGPVRLRAEADFILATSKAKAVAAPARGMTRLLAAASMGALAAALPGAIGAYARHQHNGHDRDRNGICGRRE
ncbi:MAG: hypothetical protein NXH72_13265 [Hyphomonadaceae bacterium]|nr:hypothetical protein [Hyphomonadaceae bacterium]